VTHPCPACGCANADSANVHVIHAALADGDLDRAIDLGLLTAQPCAFCKPTCTEALVASRDARLVALAARDRYRARQQRLERRASMRDASRPMPTRPVEDTPTTAAAPALPPAVAAALARAKARAAGNSAT
jgi:hypothetical protein